MKVLAVIPARAGSKRIPKKNIKKFIGKEVISYPITALLQTDVIDKVIVSTDSLEIKNIAEYYGAEVPFLRSKKNSDDFATTFDVVEEVCSQIKDVQQYDYICCLYPTSVFITTDILNNALDTLHKKNSDGLVTVIEYSHPIQRALEIDSTGMVVSINPKFYNTRSQDLVPRYHDAGQLYIFKLKTILKSKKLITAKTIPYIISQTQAQDIDTLDDWKLAELKFLHMQEG